MKNVKGFMYFMILNLILSGCSSFKKYPYYLSSKNKGVIKQVFLSGNTSCEGHIYCWEISSENSSEKLYSIRGSRRLFMKIKLDSQSYKDGPEFKVKLKVTNAGFRLKRIESLFLEELGTRLYLENQQSVKRELDTIYMKENEKSNDQKNHERPKE